MEIGCGTVVFRQFSLERALEAIRNAGYEYIETQAVYHWCPHVDVDKDDPVKFAEKVKGFGFKGITALWMPYGTFIFDEKSIEYAKRSIVWAAAAGIGVVNTGDGFKPVDMDNGSALDILKERLSEVLEIADTSNVHLAIEPHGSFSLTLDGLLKIMALSHSKMLGINYDAANIRRAGYVESGVSGYKMKNAGNPDGTADMNDEVKVLKGVVNRVIHFHAKDLDKNMDCVALGKGIVKLKECIGVLRSAGYKGVLSLETEGGRSFEDTICLIRDSYKYLSDNLK